MNHKIISQQNHAALVEWRDAENNLHRSIVPSVNATPDISEQELAAGIPFGVPWETFLNDALALRLANRLREQSLWTYADAANNVRVLRAIVNEVVVASLLDAARGVK